MIADRIGIKGYGRLMIGVAGLGGLLYGIDVGIIAAALLYLGKTINLTVEQTSIIVAAVLGGSMISSLVAGVFADWFGRKKMMSVAGLMFVASVGLIVISQTFTLLFVGRLLQGMSGGVIAVVVPLYLAECLGANERGKGTAIFQFMLTFGIVVAAMTGFFYIRGAEAAIASAAGNADLILAAENHAWRGMFLSVVYPGLAFFAGSFLLIETPRWLFRKGKTAEARASLGLLVEPTEAAQQFSEMESLANETQKDQAGSAGGSLLRRKYVVPFVLACVILAANQATGINSILAFLVIILKQAGMNATHATQGDVAVKLLNCVVTVLAVALVDRKGRKFLLKLGTGGIVVALLGASYFFHAFEAQRRDVRSQVQSSVTGNTLALPVSQAEFGQNDAGRPVVLTVLYSYGSGDKVATALSSDADKVLKIVPEDSEKDAPLVIKRAYFGRVAAETTGWLVAACMGLFIFSYAIGPGVVVWLMLSELMPTRIRSTGMGIALLLNQGVSTLIASVFLTVVGNYGYFAMFLFWAICTAFYFSVAAFFVPETKGKTLEEIEAHFEGR
jgi:MFS transporter, SP family, solute carrier family 2 (myo-inositol transporter), member 13